MEQHFNPLEFKKFIVTQLKRAKLNDQTIKKLTTPNLLQEWLVAFTHKSLGSDASENYETYEILGDAVIDNVVVRYLSNKLGIINSGFLSTMRSMIVKKQSLARLGYRLGFPNFIRLGVKELTAFENIPKEEWIEKESYRSIVEDVVEAFTGVMMELVDKMSNLEAGPGYAIVTSWWWSILDALVEEGTISVDYYKIWDPVSRLKEIYDRYSKPPYEWKFNRAVEAREFTKIVGDRPKKFYEAEIIAWLSPPGVQPIEILEMNQYPKLKKVNSVVIGKGEASNIAEAKENAALQAIQVLRDEYGIIEKAKDPYKRTQK